MELKPLKDSRTAVIDLDTEEVSKDLSVPQKEKKVEAKKVLFENNTPELYMENLKKNFSTNIVVSSAPTNSTKIQFEAAETFFSEEPKSTKKQVSGQVSFSTYVNKPKVEEKIEKQVDVEPEQKIESKIDFSKTIEEILEEDIEEKQQEKINESTQRLNRGKTHVNLKTRFKIITFGFCAVLACFMGWSIYNAVEIKTLTAEMEQANKAYSVNVINYISNISKADDLTNPDSIFDLEKLSEAEVVPLQPSALEKPVEYSVKSNWFDRFCNWLGKIFG